MKWTLGHPPKYGWYLVATNLSNNPEYPDYHTLQVWYNEQGKFHSGGGYTRSQGIEWTNEIVAWAPMPEFNMELYPLE